jgi:hypothetical protein
VYNVYSGYPILYTLGGGVGCNILNLRVPFVIKFLRMRIVYPTGLPFQRTP